MKGEESRKHTNTNKGQAYILGSNETNLLSAFPYYNRRERIKVEYGH